MAEWLSSWLAEQEDRGSIPRLPLEFSEIGYLLLPSRDMAEIPLNRRKSSKNQTNHQVVSLSWTIDQRNVKKDREIAEYAFSDIFSHDEISTP